MSAASRVVFSIVGALALAGASAGPVTEPRVVACADLGAVRWGGFRVDAAEELAADADAPARCVVRGTIDAEIHFELILPRPEAFNGRFVMGGGGGFVGSVQNQALQFAPYLLDQGYATVGTDTGHRGGSLDASWALDRPDREINFGHRAVHLTVDAAKTIIRLHYGRDIEYSYWLGCSRGGGQGMMESQRFPDDFDGIVAGAPAYDWTGLGALLVQTQRAIYPDPHDLSVPAVTAEVRELLGSAILAACDALDGVADGLLADPRDCRFHPDELPRCRSSDATACLTGAQLEAIRTVYRGAQIGGEVVYPGYPLGGERDAGAWDSWIAGGADAFGAGTPSLHFAFGTQMFKYLVYDDPSWDYASYDFRRWAEDTRHAARILNATDTDLEPFRVAGGKLILWNGWSDAAITALGTIRYWEGVHALDADAASFARLFLLPGVGHCVGGSGPDRVDWLAAIQAWVEEGRAPDRLIATKLGEGGDIDMRRPLCVYPARAIYTGGDAKREESFDCGSRDR